MKTQYLQNGGLLIPTNQPIPDRLQRLPAGTYSIGADPKNGIHLVPIAPLPVPSKVYGSIGRYAERILNTFADRADSTGVLLSGEKGSGKSLLAKVMSNVLLRNGISTIVVNAPFNGDEFNQFVQMINEPAMLLFDEFEKIYSGEQQERMLTLMDGTYPTKKLFVLTCNDQWRVNSHMRNRPGRLYYALRFSGMEPEDIREYLDAELKNKEHIDSVMRFAGLFTAFNFDMLKALVQEMNRYNEPASQAYKMLNARPDNEADSSMVYDVVLLSPKEEKLNIMSGAIHRGTPSMDEDELLSLDYYNVKKRKDEMPDITHAGSADFEPRHLVQQECLYGKFVFKNADGFKAIYTPRRPAVRSYDYAF